MLGMISLGLGTNRSGPACSCRRPEPAFVRSFLSPGLLIFRIVDADHDGTGKAVSSSWGARSRSPVSRPRFRPAGNCCCIASPGWVSACCSRRSCSRLFLLQHVRYWVFGFLRKSCLALAFIQLVPIALTLVISHRRPGCVYARAAGLGAGSHRSAGRRRLRCRLPRDILDGGAPRNTPGNFAKRPLARPLAGALRGLFRGRSRPKYFSLIFLGWGAFGPRYGCRPWSLSCLGLDANFPRELDRRQPEDVPATRAGVRRGQIWGEPVAIVPVPAWRLPRCWPAALAGRRPHRVAANSSVASRGSRGMVYFLLTIVAAMDVCPAVASGSGRTGPCWSAVPLGGPCRCCRSFFLPQLLQFRFSLETWKRMDVLKTLALFRQLRLSPGELIAPRRIRHVCSNCRSRVGIALFQEQWLLIRPGVCGAGAGRSNLFVFCLRENLVFLWFPCRLVQFWAPAIFRAFGRQMLVMFLEIDDGW